ncbi:MDR family MFS transporter [Heyndrickxia sp. NPDC080065]|uniref:MDR family MFS transporter n=1 Tax=Heyndrickxia sp. NPDC080065 TaxID=3390568 RepID=UPI003CFF54DE
MKKINLKGYHPIVWTLLAGTVFARGASFMALPFLALYLSKTEGIHPVIIGLIIGVGPLTGTLGGFIGGHLSDRFGRKVVMLASVFTWAFVFIGFAYATKPIVFLLLNALNGICRSFFEPTSQALMSDVTDKEKRLRVFSMRYTAINIGAAMGPLLGAIFGAASSTITFEITGGFYLFYGIVLFILLNKYQIIKGENNKKLTSVQGAFKVLINDKALLYFILGGILVNIGYSQVESSLPQHLEKVLRDGVVLYSILLSINAITVVILQIPLSRLVEKWKVLHVMMLGSSIFVIGFIGFSFSQDWIGFILSMVLFTIGEIFLFPSTSVFIDSIAPEAMRGTYFGAAQFRSFGNFIGPIFGGWIFKQFNGQWLFGIMAFVVTLSIFSYLLGYKKQVVRGFKDVMHEQ